MHGHGRWGVPEGLRPLFFRRRSITARRHWRNLAGILCLGACLAGLAGAVHAQGIDWTLSAGAAATDSVKKLELSAGWMRAEPLWRGDRWQLRLRHEAVLAAWDVPKARNLVEVGYSPVFRLERSLAGAARQLFVEASIGVRLLSHTRVSPERFLSTAFQFSDMLGLGMSFGPGGRSAIGLRYQHLSNLGIKRPNPGINFLNVYYSHRF